MMEKMEKKEEREAGKPVKIGLVCCSNGLSESFKPAFQELLSVLNCLLYTSDAADEL